MTREHYLTQYLRQSCGWIKVAEYACRSADQAARLEAEARARHPADELRFDLRSATAPEAPCSR